MQFFKKAIIFSCLFVIINLFITVVHADTTNVVIDCDTNLVVGESVNCIVKTDLGSGVTLNGFGGELELSGNLKMESVIVDNNVWQGNGNGGNIQIYTDNQYSNIVEIAKIVIVATDKGDGYLKLKNINLSIGTNFDLESKADISKNFGISDGKTPEDNEEHEDNTFDDNKKTESENPKSETQDDSKNLEDETTTNNPSSSSSSTVKPSGNSSSNNQGGGNATPTPEISKITTVVLEIIAIILAIYSLYYLKKAKKFS